MDPSIVGSSGARFSMKDELPDLDPIQCTSDKASSSTAIETIQIECPKALNHTSRPRPLLNRKTWKLVASKEINEQRAVVPYLNKGFLRTTELLSSSYLIGKQFIADLRQRGCSPASLATRLYQLERACDFQDSFMSCTPVINLDTSLLEAIRNPLALCARTPMGWTDGRPVEGGMIELIPLIYTRIALHYLDWVASLLELIEMDEKDRLALVSAQLCQLQFCTIAYNTYREGKEGILFGAGIHFIPPETPPTDEFDSFMVQLSTYLHQEVISLFKEIKISPEEYALMKMICFFSTTAILTQKSVNVVQRARVKYEQLLMEYIVEAYPDLNREERQMRMVKIASANRHFLQLGILDNAYITKMFSLNMANLRKHAPPLIRDTNGTVLKLGGCWNVTEDTKTCSGAKCIHAYFEADWETTVVVRNCASEDFLKYLRDEWKPARVTEKLKQPMHRWWLEMCEGRPGNPWRRRGEDSTKKCTGTNKCSHAHLEKKNEQAIIKQLEIRTCATGFLLTNWTTGYQRKEIPGSHLTVTEQACEGDLCNKLPMTEMKQRAEEAAKKQSSTASYLVLPVVTFFASNILAFF
ncbi:unnamed protein product, partial [Mesorhabditis spiculigera]